MTNDVIHELNLKLIIAKSGQYKLCRCVNLFCMQSRLAVIKTGTSLKIAWENFFKKQIGIITGLRPSFEWTAWNELDSTYKL